MRSMIRSRSGEAGVVSLMVTLVMMIVITLIVLGFAEIARNEQRSSLDDQLSTQAYYAAESGVNDVRSVIANDIETGKKPSDNNQCALQGEYSSLSSAVDPAHKASYTCVIVDTHPDTLSYTVGYTSSVIPLLAESGTFNNFTFTLKVPASASASCFTAPTSPSTFPVASSWTCPMGVFRVDLLNAGAATLTRSNWNNATTTIFFVPFQSASIGVALPGSRGSAVAMPCTLNAGKDTMTCTAKICGDLACSVALGGSKYYARVTTIYQDGISLSINGGGTKFDGAQAKIDSTGKAQDVLRRVLVAVDLSDANAHPIPSGAIISRDSVCKRFSVTKTSFQVYSDLSAGGGTNPFCDVASSNGSPSP